MIRPLLTGLGVVGLATIALVQLDSTAAVIAWELVLAGAVALVRWGSWPGRPRHTGALLRGRGWRSRRPHALTPLELEVAAALDPTLAGAQVLRKRLLALLHQRAGLPDAAVDSADGRLLIGDQAWESLVGERPLEIGELEHLIERIEAL